MGKCIFLDFSWLCGISLYHSEEVQVAFICCDFWINPMYSLFSKASEIYLGKLKLCKTTILLRWFSFSTCAAARLCLEPRCLGGLTNKLARGGFLGLYLSVNTPMGVPVPLHLAQVLFAERSVSKVTNIPINDHLGHHDEKHHVKTRCQILCSMRLQSVSKILTPCRMLKKTSLIAKINRRNNSFQNMYDML